MCLRLCDVFRLTANLAQKSIPDMLLCFCEVVGAQVVPLHSLGALVVPHAVVGACVVPVYCNGAPVVPAAGDVV